MPIRNLFKYARTEDENLNRAFSSVKDQFDSITRHINNRPEMINVNFFSSFAIAVAAVGNAVTTLYIPDNQPVAGSIATPTTLTLKFGPAGFLSIATGKTVTINGNIDAGLTKIFSCAGTGKVVFGAGAVKEVYPEWWGAVGDRAIDDIDALNAASKCLNNSGGGTFKAVSLEYGISGPFIGYSNVKYKGIGGSGMYGTDTPAINRGTTLVWLGGNTGTMVSLSNTWGLNWDGISLEGTYAEEGPSTLIGFDIETNTPLVIGAKNSQRNFLENFSIRNCETAIAFDRNFEDAGNTDGWVIEKFYFDFCNKGITLNSIHIAYSTIRNGAIHVYTTGIDLERCGWIKLESIAFGGRANNSGAAVHISDHSGTIIIEGCQSEGGIGRHFAILDGEATKVTPTTFIGNYLCQPIDVNTAQDNLTFIGNYISTTINLANAIINCLDINNEEVAGGGFVVGGPLNYLGRVKWESNGTWIPRLFQGTTEITSPTEAVGTFIKKGRLVFIKMSFYKANGAPSASGTWGLQGLPFGSASDGTGAILTAGAVNFNGTIYSNTNPAYWRYPANSTTPVLEGLNAATSWESGAIVMTLSGVYETDE